MISQRRAMTMVKIPKSEMAEQLAMMKVQNLLAMIKVQMKKKTKQQPL
jgi:hypothetical protein